MSSPKRSSPLAKKRNPQDSTRRNVQAGVKRDAGLLARIQALEHRLSDLERANYISFESQQGALGYRHSTSWPGKIRVKG